jgi:hypothetical protein
MWLTVLEQLASQTGVYADAEESTGTDKEEEGAIQPLFDSQAAAGPSRGSSVLKVQQLQGQAPLTWAERVGCVPVYVVLASWRQRIETCAMCFNSTMLAGGPSCRLGPLSMIGQPGEQIEPGEGACDWPLVTQCDLS